MVKNRSKKISIIIPACNEENRIKRTLVSYLNYFTHDCEILVVLNGCHDNTLEIVKTVSARYPSLKYRNIAEPIGKGGALIVGFKLVKGDIIAYIDADGATSSEELARLIGNIGEYDGILGSRWLRNSIISKKQPLSRKIASRVFNILVRGLFLFPYKDTQCGAKIFKKEVIKSVVNELGTTDFAFDVDLLYLIHKKGYKIKEFSTVWADQDASTLNLKKVVPIMFASIIRLRLKHSIFKNLIA